MRGDGSFGLFVQALWSVFFIPFSRCNTISSSYVWSAKVKGWISGLLMSQMKVEKCRVVIQQSFSLKESDLVRWICSN